MLSATTKSKRTFFSFNILMLVLLNFSFVYPVTVGDYSAPSREGVTVFSGVGNEMIGFATFAEGFTLTDDSTTCSYDGYMFVTDDVELNGGQLFLQEDLIFANVLNLASGGTIWGRDASVMFPKAVEQFQLPVTAAGDPFRFDNCTLIFKSPVKVNTPLYFQGDCTICAFGNIVTLSNSAPLIVLPGGNLTIRDAFLDGVGDDNIRCSDDASLVTVENCEMFLARDFTFATGSMLCKGDVSVCGTNKFIMAGSSEVNIDTEARLTFDLETTLSYAPDIADRTLLGFVDDTSMLYLNGCTLHTTRTGIDFSTGRLVIDNHVTISSEAIHVPEGIVFGSDFATTVLSGALLDVHGIVKIA